MRLFLFGIILILAPRHASAQDSARVGIHQQESYIHYWDKLKCDSAAPDLLRGKEKALAHRFAEAERCFKQALKTRKPLAYFDLGVLHSYLRNDSLAVEYFRRSYTMQKDSVCLEELRSVERRLRFDKRNKR